MCMYVGHTGLKKGVIDGVQTIRSWNLWSEDEWVGVERVGDEKVSED